MKHKVLWGSFMIVLHGISYVLARFDFSHLHGMKDWPNFLAKIGLIVIITATFLDKPIISLSAVAGYMGGFIFGMTFDTYRLDQGGSFSNNAWAIWGAVFILSILIGTIIEFLPKLKSRLKMIKLI